MSQHLSYACACVCMQSAGIIGSGHRFAASRLSAQRSTAGWVGEAMGGLSYLEYIRELSKRVESDWEGVAADLEAIRKAILQRAGTIVNLTGDERALSAAAEHVEDLLGALPSSSGSSSEAWSGVLPRANEALVVPTQVRGGGRRAGRGSGCGCGVAAACETTAARQRLVMCCVHRRALEAAVLWRWGTNRRGYRLLCVC